MMVNKEVRDSEIQQVMEVIERISTPTCGGSQPRFLFELSRKCRGRGAIVEIGSMAGRSTIALAFGQKVEHGQKVYAIDCSPARDLVANLERAGVTSWVELVIGRSSAVAKRWTQPLKLLFIDGNHSFLGCRSDIRAWTPHVTDGGIVVFHDYGAEGNRGVHQAVYVELFSRPSVWKTISDREAGSMLVIQRQPDLAWARGGPRMALTRLRQFLMVRENLEYIVGDLKGR